MIPSRTKLARKALEKLRLNDSSFTFQPETSGALGPGFRCGFQCSLDGSDFSNLVLYVTFADAWRVTSASSLFDYDSGFSTSNFTLPDWPVNEATGCIGSPAAKPSADQLVQRVVPANILGGREHLPVGRDQGQQVGAPLLQDQVPYGFFFGLAQLANLRFHRL